MDINIHSHTVSQYLNIYCLTTKPFAKMCWLFSYISIPYSCHLQPFHTQWTTMDLSHTIHGLGHCWPPTSHSRIPNSISALVWGPGCEQKRSELQDSILFSVKSIEAWKPSTWEDLTDKEDPTKVFDKFENSFQTSNTQWVTGKIPITLSNRMTRQWNN